MVSKWNIFQKKKRVSAADKNATPAETIGKLRSSIENAEKREAFLQHKMHNLVQDAKMKMAKGDKRGALSILKRKKMYQSELEKTENVKMTLEMQAMQLESATHNQETLRTMQSGNSAMKRLRKAFGIDKVDEVMDDIREEADLAQEISTAIATPIDPYMMDDDELLKELNEFEEGPTATKASSFSSMFSMPRLPRKSQKQQDHDDLKRLEAELTAA